MSDNVSLINAIKLVAKATREDTAKVSDMVKGALRSDQIDDVRLTAATSATAPTAKAGPANTSSTATARGERATSVHRRAWKWANKASAKFQEVPPSLDREYPPLAPAAGPSWQRVHRQPSRPLVGEAERLIRRYLPPTQRWLL